MEAISWFSHVFSHVVSLWKSILIMPCINQLLFSPTNLRAYNEYRLFVTYITTDFPSYFPANECHLATIIFDIAKCPCLFLIHILPELIKTFCRTFIRICRNNLAILQWKRRLIRKSSFAGLLFRALEGRGVSIKHFEAKQLKERTGSLQCAVTSQD